MRNILFLALSILFIVPIIPASAETDTLGYHYSIKKASEIDFSDGNFYITPISGDQKSKDPLYAVYDNSEIERYERELLGTRSMITPYAALPTKFSEYYSSSAWRTRTDGITLSLYPKDNAWKSSSNGVVQAHLEKYRWEVVYNKHKNDRNWKNTNSMKAQLHCHANTVRGTKNPWNIEPWRTETNYQKVVLAKCNPKP